MWPKHHWAWSEVQVMCPGCANMHTNSTTLWFLPDVQKLLLCALDFARGAARAPHSWPLRLPALQWQWWLMWFAQISSDTALSQIIQQKEANSVAVGFCSPQEIPGCCPIEVAACSCVLELAMLTLAYMRDPARLCSSFSEQRYCNV